VAGQAVTVVFWRQHIRRGGAAAAVRRMAGRHLGKQAENKMTKNHNVILCESLRRLSVPPK